MPDIFDHKWLDHECRQNGCHSLILGDALRELIYETTHLSAPDGDGAHLCKISKEALDKARSALVRVSSNTDK